MPILLEAVAAIGAGKIDIARLQDVDDNEILFGLCEPDGQITIDEGALVVDALLHEAIHRMRRRFPEGGVEETARRIFTNLRREEIESIYQVYLGVGKRRSWMKTFGKKRNETMLS